MASPQKENGYTAIANELMDALVSFRIPGELRQVFDCIVRKTYGYNKKEDAIANSQIVEATGMLKGNVSRSLSILITHRLVIKADNPAGKGNILRLNKDYSKWVSFVIKSDNKKIKKKKLSRVIRKLSEPITKVIRSDIKKLSEVRDTKDITILKDNTKDITREKSRTPEKARKKSRKDMLVDPTPMDLKQFLEWCRKPSKGRDKPARHIEVIAEWAEAEQPAYTTKGQWTSFIRRNGRAAMNLVAFSNEQLQNAYEKMLKDIVKVDKNTGRKVGFITKYTLETLGKYL